MKTALATSRRATETAAADLEKRLAAVRPAVHSLEKAAARVDEKAETAASLLLELEAARLTAKDLQMSALRAAPPVAAEEPAPKRAAPRKRAGARKSAPKAAPKAEAKKAEDAAPDGMNGINHEALANRLAEALADRRAAEPESAS